MDGVDWDGAEWERGAANPDYLDLNCACFV